MNKIVNFYKNQTKFYNRNSYIAKVLINVVTILLSILIQRLLIKNVEGFFLFVTVFLLYVVLFPVGSYLFYRLRNNQ